MTHYVAKTRIKMFIQQALEYAWGPTKKPLAGRKRLKVKTGEQGDVLGIPGINGGKPTPAGATIEMVVEGTNVYIVENGEETLFTLDNAKFPSFKDTWIPRMITNRADWYDWIMSRGEYESNTTTETVINKDGKEEVRVVKKPRVKGPPKELAGKVGGRRRVVRSRPATPKVDEKDAKKESKKEKSA